MIEVRTMKLSALRDREAFLLSEASCQRRERAARFIQLDDRLRCLAAGYLMKHCLPGYSETMLYTGVDGKPFLKNGVPFSITHGGDYIALAWCEDAEGVGIDVEPIREMDYYRAIIPCFMTAGEIKAVDDSAKDAVRIWTRKECLYKSVGEGISDFRELPEVLVDRVQFFGMPFRLTSWEAEGHFFSAALQGSDKPIALRIKNELI